MPIDLHTHSTVSDGTLSPAEVVEAAATAGLSTVALTDHDSTGGWDAAAAAARTHGIALVRGIEISCARAGVSIHLLAYLPDPDHADLADELAHARSSRQTRLARIVSLMAADGIPITTADVLAHTDGDATTVGRPHVADALVAAGVVPDRDAAFVRYLGNDSRYYVAHYAPDPVKAVALVRAAGGVPVIAHPFAGRRGRIASTAVIETMAHAGLAGIEADHRDHTDEERARGHELARRLGLFVTGSSDFHGTGKLNRLGEFSTTPEVLALIEEQSTSGVRVVRG